MYIARKKGAAGKPIDDYNQDTVFPKLGHFFSIFEKEQGRPLPLPPLVMHLAYSISLILLLKDKDWE